ncbi:MAG: nicotinic acid mononucleotide adenylyltransferase [Gammaproteobacteria bacterium]|nr:MAG: nicotinic acid mononucleotide adenylyltransferase [Gammaproteobacteria bacterium]
MSDAPEKPIAIFGGTFDPVHFGHLRTALELVEALNLDHLRLMPSANPPHRDAPQRSAQDRANMVALAVAEEPRLRIERCELERDGPSYTVDSLLHIRKQIGEKRSLCLVLGSDAALKLPTWSRWERLLDLAHLLIIARPGWVIPPGHRVSQWLAGHRVSEPSAVRGAAGCVLIHELRQLAISATEIREMIALGRSPRYLLPESVLSYIRERKLYG